MRFKRRQILLAGVTAGVAATVGQEYVSRQAQQARDAKLLAHNSTDPIEILKESFAADAQKINAGVKIQSAVPATRPTIPYDRKISNLLIQCSKLATQQYLAGKALPTYDGSIRSLPTYFSELDEYQQIASFKGHEAEVEDSIEVNVPTTAQNNPQDPLEQQANEAQDTIGQTVKETVKLKQLTPVYLGFVLASKKQTIIVFRGTQRNTEWLHNFYARQEDYYHHPSSSESLGRVHRGFVANYKSILDPIPRDVAQKLDPSIPCYITGHSLGAALAVLAALDLALNIPALKSQIQLYTYAGARVGDPKFAQFYTQQIQNHYRIVNLADIVPMLPPIQSPGGTYVHTGEEWSFLTQQADFLPNHVVETYRQAIVNQVETNQPRNYPVSG